MGVPAEVDGGRGPRLESEVDTWESHPFNFPFRVGEFTLFRMTFEAVVNTAHFLGTSPIQSPLPPSFFASCPETLAVDNSRPVLKTLPRLCRVPGGFRYVTWQYDRQFVRLDGDFEQYEKCMKGKTRGTLRRKVRKFLGDAPAEQAFRVFRTPEEIAQFWRDARRVSAKSYQERLLDQGLPTSEEYRKGLEDRAEASTVIGWVLYSNETPVAYTLGEVVSEDTILYGPTGYDPAFAEKSPGTVLQYLILKFLFDETELRIYDLCVGEAAHKRLFANGNQRCADLLFFKPTVRTWVAVLVHYGLSVTNEFVLKVLDRLQVKLVIKRMIRRRGGR